VPVILIGGGSRSGKSSYALQLAREKGERRVFVATAQGLDEEMLDRIERHQQERGDAFHTKEIPIELAGALPALALDYEVILLDCLTLWLSNVMFAEGVDVEPAVDELLSTVRELKGVTLVVVTNEVGSGIVPDSKLAREFRDHAGWLNARFAEVADEVYYMVFGCPLRAK
jgi:adenosylcobinamide kinase/adenosylcobinamide-phosphate guanylyltransferase